MTPTTEHSNSTPFCRLEEQQSVRLFRLASTARAFNSAAPSTKSRTVRSVYSNFAACVLDVFLTNAYCRMHRVSKFDAECTTVHCTEYYRKNSF